jgi:hypothetical protein
MVKWILAACVLLAAPVSAATYYVAPSPVGNDGRACSPMAQSIATPRATIVAGIACLSAGDTLIVRAGTYPEFITSIPSGTSWSNIVRIAAYTGETVWITPTGGTNSRGIGRVIDFRGSEQYIELDGINLSAANIGNVTVCFCGSGHDIRIKNAELIGTASGTNCGIICGGESVELQHLVIHGGGSGGSCGTPCATYGWYTGGSNNTLEYSEIYDVGSLGVQIYNGVASDNIIRFNRIHDIVRTDAGTRVTGTLGLSGVLVASGNNNLVYNNLIYNNGFASGHSGVDVYAGGTTGTKIWNNTIYGNSGYGVHIDSGVPDATIQNNILYGNSTAAICTSGCKGPGSSGITYDHNIDSADPLFIDAGAANFQLSSNSSPAVNAGASLATVTTDFAGITRPQGGIYDAGAYEFVAGAPPPIITSPTHATGTVIITESFTGSSGTPLESHIGEVGATWVKHLGMTGNLVLSNANRLRVDTSDTSSWYDASGVPTSTDYDCSGDFKVFSLEALHYTSLLCRMMTNAATGYAIQYNIADARWELFYWLNGDTYTLQTYSTALTVGSTYSAMLLMRGSQLTVEVDGTPIMQTTDATITGPGRLGINIYAVGSADTNATGIHLDNISLRQVDTITPPPPVTTTARRLRFKRIS